ncbi:MAG: alpha/beta fold hydrolase [Proteobacteria bacterium]|nr:alpha/beta fold hydrolase [Pseudomonadota bacterium]
MKKTVLLLALLFVQATFAENVTITLENGFTANANFRSHSTDKPAIIVVHGFLSTYNYNTVQVISDELYNKGYTVLTPNLTLGISNRSEPIPCNTLHRSTMNNEGDEVNAWLDWLGSKGYKHFALVGHSAGSNSILVSLEKNKTPLDAIILTALYDFSALPEKVLERDKKRAQNNLIADKPDTYSLALCRGNYLATSSNYLSYLNWTKTRIIDTLNRSPYPITVIMPGKDSRLEGTDWLEQLRQTKAKVALIPNADHFFTSDAEFDLTEAINQALNTK